MRIIAILFLLLLTSTAFAELTKEDIRTIIKEEVPPIVKEEITASEKRTREYINLKVEAINARIDAVNARIDALNAIVEGRFDALNTRMEDVDSRFDRIWLAIIALITAAIALPQLIILYAERKRGREVQTLIQQLRDKNETTPPSS